MRTRELPSALADRTHLVGEGQPVQAAVKMANAPDLSLRGRFAPMAISPARSGQCRGAACRSRRRTCNLYKPPSKWQTLPTCHCEERSDVAISQYHVGYHESSGENVTAFPRLPRPLWGLAMTIWGQFHFNDALCQSAAPRRAGLSPTLQHIFGSLTKSPPTGPLPAGPRCGRGGRYYAGPRRGHRPSCRSGRGR